jgi:hypothetical protein
MAAMPSDRIVSRCLLATAVVNVAAGAAAIVAPGLHGRLMFTDAVALEGLLLRYHLMLWGFVVVLGIGYGLAARDPAGQRPLVLAGGLGKLVAAAVWTEMLVTGVGTPLLAAPVAWDGVLGTVFVVYAWRARDGAAISGGAGGSRAG